MKKLVLTGVVLAVAVLAAPALSEAREKNPEETQIINVEEGEGDELTAKTVGPEIGTVEATDPTIEVDSLIEIRDGFQDQIHATAGSL